MGIEQRLFGDDIDDAAGVHDAVEQRGRALQHLDALGRRVECPALHDRHTIMHDRAVAVAAKAALQDGVLRGRERVALGDPADIGQHIVQIAGPLVPDDLGRHDVDRLRRFERGRRGPQRRGIRRRLVAVVGRLGRGRGAAGDDDIPIALPRRDASFPGGLGLRGRRQRQTCSEQATGDRFHLAHSPRR